MTKKILSLDFDGVCHSYTSGWKGVTEIPDSPVLGMWEFLEKAVEVFTVQIYSTRSETAEGRAAMKAWFEDWADTTERVDIAHRILQFPESKPKAYVGLDDRVLTFDGTWPQILDLVHFKPWNKK